MCMIMGALQDTSHIVRGAAELVKPNPKRLSLSLSVYLSLSINVFLSISIYLSLSLYLSSPLSSYFSPRHISLSFSINISLSLSPIREALQETFHIVRGAAVLVTCLLFSLTHL